MGINTKFQQLTQTWYDLIGDDHHKDRDCHFRVYRMHQEYSYGHQTPNKNCWIFEHNGYILGDVVESFDTEQHLYEWACDWLEQQIQQELAHINTNDDSW
jgi:hypothetical protein